MNTGGILKIGIGVIVAIGIVFGVWYVFFSGSLFQKNSISTPTPLPTNSATVSTIPSSLSNSIAFRGVCVDTWTGQQDTDNDGLPDTVEAIYGTDSKKTDTDGDGYSDSAEVRTGHDPLNPNSSVALDSDHDSLQDNIECSTWHTDPFNPDSDGDGFTDGAEVSAGFNPAKKGDGKGNDRLPTPIPVALTPLPTFSPRTTTTPNPIGNTFTPTPFPQPTQNANTGSLILVPLSELKITTKTSAQDMKTYLSAIDALRPQELSDGQIITNAIKSSAEGNSAPLASARARIQQFAVSLKSVSVPQNASSYHQLYVTLIQFTGQQLQLIEQNAVSNQAVASQALQSLQTSLPVYVNQLAGLRTQVDTIANGK